MNKSVNCVLLIDDDMATNFFNKRVVSKHQCFNTVKTVQSGSAALEYFTDVEKEKAIKPDLVFLDINMPAMNGWEFLVEYAKLNREIREGVRVIVLSTSSNPDDFAMSKINKSVSDFINKPLSLDSLDSILNDHF